MGDYAAEYQDRESRAVTAMNQNKTIEALQIAIENPPYWAEQDIKDKNADLFLDVVARVKESDIKKHVEPLNNEQLDALMKYVYRGLERKPAQATALLKYHECIREKAGQGAIVRALVESPV
mmetsp:Transcript_31340/g.48921  ORF Transcript_31340/g.48921 Transcript_31340/m.48921 type:complete len:122 (-) Transcript_31340:54-419(-)